MAVLTQSVPRTHPYTAYVPVTRRQCMVGLTQSVPHTHTHTDTRSIRLCHTAPVYSGVNSVCPTYTYTYTAYTSLVTRHQCMAVLTQSVPRTHTHTHTQPIRLCHTASVYGSVISVCPTYTYTYTAYTSVSHGASVWRG